MLEVELPDDAGESVLVFGTPDDTPLVGLFEIEIEPLSEEEAGNPELDKSESVGLTDDEVSEGSCGAELEEPPKPVGFDVPDVVPPGALVV